MFFYTAIRRFVIILSVFICFLSPVVDLAAQEFDDDPLMLDGGDEFGFDQLGEEGVQRSEFGAEGLQGFDPQPEQSTLDPFVDEKKEDVER